MKEYMVEVVMRAYAEVAVAARNEEEAIELAYDKTNLEDTYDWAFEDAKVVSGRDLSSAG